MLQSLDVISINLWLSIISLANLVILFLLVKKFLFGPVNKILAKREQEINENYDAAQQAQTLADESKKEWEEKLSGAKMEADSILSEATQNAKTRSEKIVSEAKVQAERIVNQAEKDALLEYKKAAEDMKREIVEVSGALAEKMLAREINTEDHHALIDSFIQKIGDDDDGRE